MRSPRQRQQLAKLFFKRILLLSLACFVVGASWSVWNVSRKARESGLLKQQAQLQLADLQGRQQQLHADVESLKTQRGMEEALREQYALAANGERMIVILDSAPPLPMQATSTFMDKLKNAFKWW